MTDTQEIPRSQATPGASERVFANVLCAVDGTRRSYMAVEQAAMLAGPDAELTLLAVTGVTGSGPYKSAAIAHTRAKLILHHAAAIAHAVGVRQRRSSTRRRRPRT